MIGAAAAGLVGAGLETAGSLVSSAFNVSEQRKQREWQERMANTAYQRQVADMRAAGINPMLAAMKGGGADTPNVQPAQVENPLSQSGRHGSAYAEARFARDQLAVTKAQSEASIAKMLSEIDYNVMAAREREEMAESHAAGRWELPYKFALLEEQAKVAGWSARYSEAGFPWEQAKGMGGDYVKRMLEAFKKDKGAWRSPEEAAKFIGDVIGLRFSQGGEGFGSHLFWSPFGTSSSRSAMEYLGVVKRWLEELGTGAREKIMTPAPNADVKR